MSAERNYHLLVIDDDRYFSDGLTKLISDIYPGIVLRQEIQDVRFIDYLLISSDSITTDIMWALSKKTSEGSKLIVMNETSGKQAKCHDFIQYNQVEQLTKNATSRDIGCFMASIIPETGRKKQKATLYLTTAAHADAIVQSLTPQEIKTLKHMRHGASLTQIAHRLNINPKTVSHYKRAVMKKLGFKKNTELYSWICSL